MKRGLCTSNRVLGGNEHSKPRLRLRWGGHHPVSRSTALWVTGVSASTLWNVYPQLPQLGDFWGTRLPWEPFRPLGPGVSSEGVLGPRPGSVAERS